jgi:hypothetical protein
MADEGSDPKDESTAGKPRLRSPYVKPGFAWEEPLGDRPNLMTACGQRPAEADDCTGAPYS